MPVLFLADHSDKLFQREQIIPVTLIERCPVVFWNHENYALMLHFLQLVG